MKFIRRRHDILQVLPISLKTKHTYTFFSGFGLIQGLLLLVLALFAVNYNNNMAMIGVSFLWAFYALALVRNYKTLKNISIVEASHSFSGEGEEGWLTVRFNQRKIRASYPLVHLQYNNCIFDVVFDAHGESVVKIPYQKEHLGLYNFPQIRIFSYWPVGISQTWVYSKPQTVVCVLPLEYKREASGSHVSEMWYTPPQSASVGDVEGAREVAPGERGVKIAWKQSFRRNKMMTYTYEKSGRDTTLIDWPTEEGLTVEQKLRVVSGAIGNALRSEVLFQVRHPNYVSIVGGTEREAQEVLQTLMNHVLDTQEWS